MRINTDMANIVIYTTTNCPYCKMLKGYLSEKSISFEEKNVEENAAFQEEMLAVSDGFRGTPFTVITKNDGTQVKVKGFDKELVDQTLNLQ